MEKDESVVSHGQVIVLKELTFYDFCVNLSPGQEENGITETQIVFVS